MNNIAVSMGGLSQRATLLHRRVLSKCGLEKEIVEASVPDNNPIATLAKGIVEAW